MDTIKIVLAGQPNVGKSMLINAMSGSNGLKVGNFSGVTVEKTEVCFEHHCHQFEMVDLPGTYSIRGFSKEEKVAYEYLSNEEYDVIINVLDSTHLQRNLLLTLELLKLNKKMVLALNMADEAKKEGIDIDVKQLEKIIGVPVVLVSANTKEGVDELLDKIHDIADSCYRPKSNITYSDAMEEEILDIQKFLDDRGFKIRDLSSREIATRLLFEDKDLYKELRDEPIMIELQPLVLKALQHLYTHHETKNIKEIKYNEYNAIARGIKMEVIKCNRAGSGKNLTKKIDDVLIHKYFGIPIFLFLMWGLFHLIFTIGDIPVEIISRAFSSFGAWMGSHISNEFLRNVIVDGIIAGVGAVLSFLPNIILLYIGIALLETTGYMSRVAFLLDGFFHKFGLHGKSFIPLVTGFGCSVPAYMAARTLKSEKDRLITLFIIGFMSCGARLPIYMLFTSAFIEDKSIAGNVLFVIYISGALLGLVMAKILRVVVFKGEDEPFVMEMPKYRFPSFKLIWHTVYNNAKGYVKKAGSFILLASILVWVLATYPSQKGIEESYIAKIEQTQNMQEKLDLENELNVKKLENSYLGQIGKATEPFFRPLGFDWKMVVALESGLAAKEIVVSTLSILYNGKGDTLANRLRDSIPPASAMAFIVFVMLYLPCLAASMVFAKEAGGYKYLVYLFIFTTATAWIFSFITYKAVELFV
ncbi:MAG: ferrous iron transport protein B [Epsilonproteobacteria bacterium]|nr:ferrous iron transport protein B [Campylobacterota bacterium]